MNMEQPVCCKLAVDLCWYAVGLVVSVWCLLAGWSTWLWLNIYNVVGDEDLDAYPWASVRRVA